MTFEQLFPGYLQSCTSLHDKLVPAALALLVLSFAFYFWTAPPDPLDLIKFLAKLFLIMLLITQSKEWIDLGKQGVRTFVQENVKARPEAVAERYKEKLNASEEPENFDKEFVRIAYAEKGYRGDGDIPSMPNELWVAASERYITIYEMLTGKTFEAGAYPIEERLLKNLKELL